MQQIADVDVQMKEQTTVDVDSDSVLATILVSGLSYFFYVVAEMAADLIAVDVEMIAYGLSSCCSSAVDAEVLEVAVVADVTIAATKISFPLTKLLSTWQKLYIFSTSFSYIFLSSF